MYLLERIEFNNHMKAIFLLPMLGLWSCTTTASDEEVVHSPTPEIMVEEPVSIDSTKLSFPWLDDFDVANTIINRVDVPDGFERLDFDEGSFGHWLRRLPLKPGKPDVKLYDGNLKYNQEAHEYVLDLDVGEKDLQQCADACMRLRSEYLYDKKNYESLHFNYTNGAKVGFQKWASGYYPIPKGSKVTWVQKSSCNDSYGSFKKYMIQIFNYAGTASLSKEMITKTIHEIAPGDLFILGGHPGHSVMVMDVAIHSETGEKAFILAQSYMPAQEMHILKNPENSSSSPWYKVNEIGEEFATPEWMFERSELKTWAD